VNSFKLSLLCYPYHASKHTGRGHDRYIAELADNIPVECPEVALDVVDRGFSRRLVDGMKKLPLQAYDLLTRDADVYHATSSVAGATALALGKGPLVTMIHDVIPFNLSGYDSSLKYQLWRQFIKLCVGKGAAVIVPYQITKDWLIENLRADPAKVHVVNYGVDHATYFARPEVARAPRTILNVGEVSRSKGVDVLIRAFAEIKRRVPDARLIIAGKPSLDQAFLKGLAEQLGVADLSFIGFIAENELADYYAKATVMVFPSNCGFGLSTLEAMACGTPVVAVRALDAPEFIADAGLLAEPNNPEELARCLERVLTEPALQQDLSQRSLARAKLFSWARTARETVGVCASVARQSLHSTTRSPAS
jgi:glycosyltransferase involved in cell wall biosynthesis